MTASRVRTRIRTALAAADRDQKDVAALITIAKHLRVPISALLDDSETSEAVTAR